MATTSTNLDARDAGPPALPDAAADEHARKMLAWRERAIGAIALSLLLPAIAIGLHALLPEASTVPERAFGIAMAAGGVGGLFLCVASLFVWYHLYQLAAARGGQGYAVGHVALSVLLAPVLYVGILLVPLLVASDVTQRVAEWRRSRRRTAPEQALRILSGLAALLAGGFVATLFEDAWGLVVGLAVAAVILRLLNRVASSFAEDPERF